MEKLSEKKLSTETIYSGKIFTVTKDQVELSNGMIRQRDIVHHNGGVVIYAEKNNKLLMVKQYRYAAQQVLYEFPAGKLDKPNEDILSAAKRELEEETGHIAQDWEYMGCVYPTPGFCTEKLHLFKASGLSETHQHPDEGEILDFLEIEKEKVFEMIKNNEIIDAKTICAVLKACAL